MKQQTLAEWLIRLESLHPRAIDLGLERVEKVAARLLLPQSLKNDRTRVVTIAGTNGKGSCVATLEALMLAQGLTVGAYTSPHFLAYNERIRINGKNASDHAIISAFEKIEQQRSDISLTYFEFGTLAALILFAAEPVDVVLLEVGLGGRLDAVNIIDPDVAIVTSVDLDHQAWLGNDRETIGKEKAGIFRTDVPAICAELAPPQSVLDYAHQINASLFRNGCEYQWAIADDDGEWHWKGLTNGKLVSLNNLVIPPLPLGSVAAAIQTMFLLNLELDAAALNAVFVKLSLMGRDQKLSIEGKSLLLDVAHNPAAVNYLAERLEAKPIQGKTIALFAAMADKDCDGMISRLSGLIDYWTVAGLPSIERAAKVEELDRCRQEFSLRGESCATVTDALKRALTIADEGDRILVFGSFFTVSEVLEYCQSAESDSADV